MIKTILSGAIVLSAFSSSVFADDHVMLIEWDGTPGQFESTIMADTTETGEQAHDVYMLEANKVYLQYSELNLSSSCAIVGAEYGDGEHPATIQPITGADGASQFTGWPNAAIKTYGENQEYHFENLLFNGVFADESGALFGVLCTYGEGNTIIVNEVTSVHNSVITYFNFGQAEKWHLTNNMAVQYTSYPGGMYFGGFFWGGGAWGGTLTELVIQNNTIEGAHGEGMVLWDNTILNPEAGGTDDDAVIDHNTFVNIINWPKFYRGGNNSHWTNNLMVNMVAGPQTHNSHGQGPSLNHPGGHGYMGTLSQSACNDSTLLAQGRCWDNTARDIHYNNNAWHVTDEMYALQNDFEPWCWDVTDTNNVVTTYCDTMIGGIGSTFDYTQARWMDDSTAAQEVNGVTEENNIEAPDLGFNLDPVYTTTQITRTIDWLDNKVHDNHADNIGWNYQADGSNIVVEWPIPMDFSYSTSSVAYTHAEDGFPVGDLNHFPDKLAEWEGMEDMHDFDEPFTYARTFLDLNDTLSGVVEGEPGRWQSAPHGVVVAPDGNVWVGLYAGSGRQEILASGDTVHYKGIYVLDPVTMDHVSYSPIEILTFPDGTSDSLTAESATSGGSRGIALDADGHILSSHYKTLYKINYMTGEGVAMWLGESSLTEAAADDNGNVFVSYVLAGERPVVTLDSDLNYVGNAIDTLGHINRTIVVTGNGEEMLLGSTWNGAGFFHWNSSIPGVIQHEPVDTFGVYYDIPASMTTINSAMGAVTANVVDTDAFADTTYDETALWVSALDLSPDEDMLVVGTLTAGWGGPLGGTNWLFDMEDLSMPYDYVGNWHNMDGSGVGVTDGPRGAAFDADGNLYLADFYSNAVYHYAYTGLNIADDDQKNVVADQYVLAQNYPNPFNPNTKIEFSIPLMEQVSVNVYNLEGRLVKTLVNQVMTPGNHVVNWNGTNEVGAKVSTGMYIYQLKTNSTYLNCKMTFIK